MWWLHSDIVRRGGQAGGVTTTRCNRGLQDLPNWDRQGISSDLRPQFAQSTEISGDSATVVLRNPENGAHRHIRLRREGDRWLVYELEIGELISP